jgi:hypothetical protein
MNLNDPTTVALLAADAFSGPGHVYALYGGLLTAVYGEPRETRDADVAVVDLTAHQARAALSHAGVEALITFEGLRFGGLLLSRRTIIVVTSQTGLNTVDLVRPRSDRYAHLALQRASDATLRDRPIRVLSLESCIACATDQRRRRSMSAGIRRVAAGEPNDARWRTVLLQQGDEIRVLGQDGGIGCACGQEDLLIRCVPQLEVPNWMASI